MREDAPLLLSVHQAAHTLGLTEGALRMRIHRGEVPVVRLGRRRVMLEPVALAALFRRECPR